MHANELLGWDARQSSHRPSSQGLNVVALENRNLLEEFTFARDSQIHMPQTFSIERAPFTVPFDEVSERSDSRSS
jgi:hypothetical protein